MPNIEDVESRLRSLFEQVGDHVDNDPGEIRTERFRRAIEEGAGGQPRRSPLRITRWGMVAIVTPAALVLSTTMAAAAPGVPAPLSLMLAGADALLSSAAVIEQSAAQLRVSVTGPDGARFEVFSLPVGSGKSLAGSCDRLVVLPAGSSGASAPLSTGEMTCSLLGASGTSRLDAQQIAQAKSEAGQAVAPWTSPAGRPYTVVYGSAESGAASSALVSADGVKGATGQVVNGWFVLYIPKGEVARFPYLRFYRANGSVLDTLPGKF